jgi:MFS superfamily sulfate permease-like transporter
MASTSSASGLAPGVLQADEDGTRRQLVVMAGVLTAPGLVIYRFAANMLYANSSRLFSDVRELLVSPPDPVRLFVLDGSEIHSLDWTSAKALRECVHMAHEAGALRDRQAAAGGTGPARLPRDQGRDRRCRGLLGHGAPRADGVLVWAG